MEYIKAIRKSVIYGNTGSKKPNIYLLELELGLRKPKKSKYNSWEDITKDIIKNRMIIKSKKEG